MFFLVKLVKRMLKSSLLKRIRASLLLFSLSTSLTISASTLHAQKLEAESIEEVQIGLNNFDSTVEKLEEQSSDVYSVSMKNQLDESIKVSFANKTFYFRPYEEREIGSFEKGMYEAKVYSLDGKYLGRVKKLVRRKDSSLSINSFVLSLYDDLPIERKDTRELKSEIFIHKEFTAPDNKYEFVKAQALSRKLKVANQSLGDVHIDVSRYGEGLVGSGWTLKKGLFEQR